MNPETYQSIIRQSPKVAEYAAVSGRLRQVAGTLAGASRQELLAIASLLEQLPEALFQPRVARMYELHRYGLRQGALGGVAKRYGISPATLKQIMQAMERGGLSVVVSEGRRRRRRSSAQPSPSALKGKGNEVTNEGRSNDARVKESIKVVTDAIAVLRQEHPDWDDFGTRKKIDFLRQETLKCRGAAISSQTLYRDWVRPLW